MEIDIEVLERIAKRARDINPHKDSRTDSFFYLLMGWVGDENSARIESILFSATAESIPPCAPQTGDSDRAARRTVPFLNLMN